MAFEITTALRKMLALKSKRKVIQGATSSGKTYGIVPILYDRCLETPNTLVTIVAETVPALKDGVVKIFKDFMYEEGRWDEDNWIGNPMEYTLSNRSKIQFKSFDSVGKAKASGKRDILFMNEANHIPYLVADALMVRSTREIWLDFNADSEFWGHTEVLKQPNTDFLSLTYLDNEAIPAGTLEDLMHRKSKAEDEDARNERGYWWNWWQVYGLGNIGSLQGTVFTDWEQVKEIPQQAYLIAYGMDFGYTNDPSTLVGVYQMDNKYYYKELLYSVGLTNQDIASIIAPIVGSEIVYADSSEPKSIEELNRKGLNVIGAEKGQDSIMYGINLMQQDKFYVTEDSINLIKELRNYVWRSDKSGGKINKPIDNHNHCFTGDTLITTNKGSVKIKDIKEGDLVLTRSGYKKVLIKFNNGLKETIEQTIHLGSFYVSLCGTKTHKIWTAKGWKELSKLKRGDKITTLKSLMVKDIISIETKNITQKVVLGYTESFGEYYFGDIPKEYHIHHVDGNKDNNNIENLNLIYKTLHLRHEGKKRYKKNKEWFKEFHAKGIEKAKEWHKSKEGKEWHSQHGKKCWINKEYRTLKCEQCNKEYRTRTNGVSKYCHQNCRAKARRNRIKNGL